jgi:hypothetical protein
LREIIDSVEKSLQTPGDAEAMPATKETAERQLDRVLGFFSRVDAKGSFLFALDTSLLALLAVNVSPDDFKECFLVVLAVFVVLLLAVSLYFTYRSAFPVLKGGHGSLIYFREIAKRTEANFIDEFIAQKDDAHVRDLLGQVWRNAEILTIKFDAMKIAFGLTAFALIPLTVFIALAAVAHAGKLILR